MIFRSIFRRKQIAAPAVIRGPISIIERMGLQLLLDAENSLDRLLLENGSWESKQLDALTRISGHFSRDPRQRIFLDVGAHWGLYAMKMAEAKTFDQIHAFEADRHNFSQMQAQIFLNKLAYEISAYNLAVSAQHKIVEMLRAVDHPLGNRAGAGIFETSEHARRFFSEHGQKGSIETLPIVQVHAAPMDDLLEASGSLIIAKIDVEGHEREALKGMKRLLHQNDIIFQIELLPGQDWTQAELAAEFNFHFLGQIEHDYYFATSSTEDVPRLTSIIAQ